MAACTACGKDNPDGFQFCGFCGASLADRGREQRKTVTVLFCDVAGSTALGESTDPEALRVRLARYFERMRAIVEHHGGTVEKFIGDAVMAVFGVPVAHEDDALRAVRAAAQMRDALPALGLQARIGVNTGEVVTGTSERLVTGDAVNVAARLEQAAAPGSVLLGASTHALVEQAVDVEEMPPLPLKGKSEPVLAYRLGRVVGAPERLHAARFVGRAREVALVAEAWQRVRQERSCEIVTVVADAGVGKSRLVAEALASISDRPRVVRGRCLSYGEGITYWPVVEVLKQLDFVPSNEAAAEAVESLLGRSATAATAEEIAWAVRKTFEEAAGEDGLIVVLDDLHWAEATFLDLVEHVALFSADARLLLVCMSRPELLERRPEWAVTIRLEPLGDEDVAELMPEEIGSDLRVRIARAAGGNPLFVTEMLAMVDGSQSEVSVPPTLQALLAARLDQLGTAERGVLARGAIEGEIFHRGAVRALAPEEPQVTPRLAALVRKQLIRPDRPQIAGEDGFRFRHLLIRDAAYDALPKSTRAELHQRFAGWLAEHGGDLVELDEVLGYHLEQAFLYMRELGTPAAELQSAARLRLRNAAQRAMARQDYPAALKLGERALALVPESEIDTMLEADRIDALAFSGDAGKALALVAEARERAALIGDRAAELTLEVQAATWHSILNPGEALQELERTVAAALPEVERLGDDLAGHFTYWAAAWTEINAGRADRALPLVERSLEHAQRLPPHYEGWVRRLMVVARDEGSTPAQELIDWVGSMEATGSRMPSVRRAVALARTARFDEARVLVCEVRQGQRERGNMMDFAQGAFAAAEIEMLAGDLQRAEEYLAEGSAFLEEQGVGGVLGTLVALQAHVLYDLGRYGEAEACADRAAEIGDRMDTTVQVPWRRAKAKVLARRGEHEAAEELAREALAMAETTDSINSQADACLDLAEVLSLRGESEGATAALGRAVILYERKGNVVMAERARGALAAA